MQRCCRGYDGINRVVHKNSGESAQTMRNEKETGVFSVGEENLAPHRTMRLPSSLHVLSLTLLGVCVPMGVEDLDFGAGYLTGGLYRKTGVHPASRRFCPTSSTHTTNCAGSCVEVLLNPTLIG